MPPTFSTTTNMIKSLIIDRDSTINHGSQDHDSPFYYILKPTHLVLKPTVREAFGVLDILQRERGLKVYLATKQKCISKGLITRPKVDDINHELERKLGFIFDGIFVEEVADDKRHIFASILVQSMVTPAQTFIIDDSAAEIDAAHSLDINTYHMSNSSDLYHVISSIL